MIGIISYGLGNVASLSNALKSLGYASYIIDRPDKFDQAEMIILPGVGSFNEAMKRLKNLGLDVGIKTFHESNKPVLGICLGMQLFASKGYEGGEIAGLDLIPGRVERIVCDLKFPHIGWNNITVEKVDDALPVKANGADYYFIHGYEFIPKNEKNVSTKDKMPI